MFLKLLFAVLALGLMLFGWVLVQSVARKAAARHPECGPYREAGGGCGGCGAAASCSTARCDED